MYVWASFPRKIYPTPRTVWINHGVRYQKKFRIRRFDSMDGVGANPPVFVEVKQRYAHVTQKQRIFIPYHDAVSISNFRQFWVN